MDDGMKIEYFMVRLSVYCIRLLWVVDIFGFRILRFLYVGNVFLC